MLDGGFAACSIHPVSLHGVSLAPSDEGVGVMRTPLRSRSTDRGGFPSHLPKHRGGSGLYKTYGLFILLRIEFLGAAHRFHSVAAVVISAYHIGVFLC